MYNKVEICGVNTSKLKTLSENEKKRLLQESKAGNKNAREELINGNLRLVLSVIQSFRNRNENPDDLFQVGCIGLIKAIDNFDPTLDVKFSTYAVPMIIGELRRYLRDFNSIRVPRSMRDVAYRALKAKEALSLKLSHEPTVEEIAKEMGEDVKTVSSALDAIMEPISLYDPIYSENGDSLYVLDQIRDDSSNDEIWLDNIAIKNALNTLGEREKSILLMRFYNGKTQTEVSQEIGISQAQVSRLEKNALEKMKKHMS
ncbi:MAG: RNA polymerase sporulation sigma factor SigG [Ruminococcaceae bacterium]|nr:RNA polymerase sporulation sigma factor SigG [Oscillospiraceae bacterium]